MCVYIIYILCQGVYISHSLNAALELNCVWHKCFDLIFVGFVKASTLVQLLMCGNCGKFDIVV